MIFKFNKTIIAKILLVFIFASIFLIILKIFFDPQIEKIEKMINIDKIQNVSWSQNQCPYIMNDSLKKILDENKLEYTNKDENKWNLYLPCTYDDINDEINNININNNNNDKRLFIINNADFLTGKDYLWEYIVKYYGTEKASQMIPMSYILSDKNDISRLKREYQKNKLYILKKNIQRQEGLKITDSLEEMLNAEKDNFVIAQELLQNPYTINERKINMRFYVLVICKNNKIDVYVFNNGFMYYTKDLFQKNNKNFGPNITTGYIDRWIYEVNPLTHEDFKKYLDNDTRKLSNIELELRQQNNKISEVTFNRIYDLLKNIFISFNGKICGGKLNDHLTFQLFGVDIAIDDNLYPKIMEMNKGPDMSAKDERDGSIKYKCTKDILKLVGVINEPNTDNGFIQIFDSENI